MNDINLAMARTKKSFGELSFEDLSKGNVPEIKEAKFSEFKWINFISPLLKRSGYRARKMFGGLAIYRKSSLQIILIEDRDKDTTYRGVKYPFFLWDGILIATEKVHHAALCKKLSGLIAHPVLGKWLYLRSNALRFEKILKALVKMVTLESPLIGVDQWKKISAETPIQNIPNLGKASTVELRKIGIKTYGDLKRLGWKKVYQLLSRKFPEKKNRNMARALLAAQLKKDWRDLSASELKKISN